MATPTRKPEDKISGDAVEGVRATIAAYCHALDDGRVDDLVALFTADGSAALPGMDAVEGREALRALYQGLVPQRPQRHLVVNTLVTGGREGGAEAVSDLLFLAQGESGWGIALVGRYEDLLRREDGRWRFVRRSLSFTSS